MFLKPFRGQLHRKRKCSKEITTKIFLSGAHAAQLLGIDKSTFERRYVHSDGGPKIRVLEFPYGYGGRTNMFLRRDVEALI